MPSRMRTIHGTLNLMSSGVSSLFALYSANWSLRNVGPGGSNTTAKWVGCSLRMTSKRALVKPNTAEVFIPLVLMRGFLMNA